MTDSNHNDWQQSQWLTAIAMTDSNRNDWQQSQWLTAIVMTDNRRNDWQPSQWLTTVAMTDINHNDWQRDKTSSINCTKLMIYLASWQSFRSALQAARRPCCEQLGCIVAPFSACRPAKCMSCAESGDVCTQCVDGYTHTDKGTCAREYDGYT